LFCQALLEKQEVERKAKEGSAKAYDTWMIQKDLREQAIRYLGHIPAPVPAVDTNDIRNSRLNLRRSTSSLLSNQKDDTPQPSSGEFESTGYGSGSYSMRFAPYDTSVLFPL
jgi:hypothetical protein